ncbi:hypothetical protein BH24ACI4_BH24ACI4_00370 [soil metagenome]
MRALTGATDAQSAAVAYRRGIAVAYELISWRHRTPAPKAPVYRPWLSIVAESAATTRRLDAGRFRDGA